jgi:two-component system NarL family sensor kinase
VRVEAGLYRIAQEALTNVARHSGAREADLSLEITPERIRLTLQDDGAGFDPTAVPPGHFGLVGLNERAKLLGGTLALQSSPGEGTRLEVTIPLGERS